MRGDSECRAGVSRLGADTAAPSQVMTDVAGNPEEERRAEFYHQPWSQEAVSRYFYCKVWDPRPGTSSSPVTPRETPHPPPHHVELSLLPDAPPGGWGPSCHSPATRHLHLLISLQIQQRRQELEQSLVVRNT